MAYNTGNPIGSTDPRDLSDNSDDIDVWATDRTKLTHPDRKGVARKTWHGIESDFEGAMDSYQEQVNDIVIAGGQIFPDEASGRAAVDDGAYYLSVGDADDVATILWERIDSTTSRRVADNPDAKIARTVAQKTKNINGDSVPGVTFAIADNRGKTPLSVDEQGVVNVPHAKIADLGFESDHGIPLALAIADGDGNAAVAIENNGRVNIKKSKLSELDFDKQELINSEYALAFTDESGNIILGFNQNGDIKGSISSDEPWLSFGIESDVSIVHIGDSYTGSHYTLKDKSYLSCLSSLSPFRHQNFGVSGDELLDMQYRITEDDAYGNYTFSQMNGKIAFISSFTNDGNFRAADISYYAENLRRLIDVVKGAGAEPVVASQFASDQTAYSAIKQVAQEKNCAFIDCTTINRQLGTLQEGPFFEGHPGVRTNGVFWLPMLDFIDSIERPKKGIKIFRKRAGYAAASVDDLLYKDRVDKIKKWKEISLSQYSLANPEKFEELDSGSLGGWLFTQDEYQKIAQGSPVSFTDYGLIEITLPGTAATISDIEIDLSLSGSANTYVRDNLDPDSAIPGRRDGTLPESTAYLDNWDKPRGAWREVFAQGGVVPITDDQIKRSMVGDVLQLLIAGTFDVSGINIRYKGEDDLSLKRNTGGGNIKTDANLLSQPLCGNASQLSSWAIEGNPQTLVPIDVYNAPSKVNSAERVDGVCVVSIGDTIAQTVNLPSDSEQTKLYCVAVWVRHFPKAYLDPSLYPGLDSAQIVDRTADPGGAEITTDTNDLRTLMLEIWEGGSYPSNGGADYFDFAPLSWREIKFFYEKLPGENAQTSIKLSCDDGEIQIARVTVKEVLS